MKKALNDDVNLIDNVAPGAMQILQPLQLLRDGVVDAVPASVKSVDLLSSAAGLTHLLAVRCHRLQLGQLLLALLLEASSCIQQRRHLRHRRRASVEHCKKLSLLILIGFNWK